MPVEDDEEELEEEEGRIIRVVSLSLDVSSSDVDVDVVDVDDDDDGVIRDREGDASSLPVVSRSGATTAETSLLLVLLWRLLHLV